MSHPSPRQQDPGQQLMADPADAAKVRRSARLGMWSAILAGVAVAGLLVGMLIVVLWVTVS